MMWTLCVHVTVYARGGISHGRGEGAGRPRDLGLGWYVFWELCGAEGAVVLLPWRLFYDLFSII